MLYHIQNIQELKSFSSKITEELHLPGVFLLEGELGTGKTTFVRCFCENLKVQEQVNSPGFNLMNIYKSASSKWGEVFIYHFDFYRLKAAKVSNISELLEEPGTYGENYICFIEWPNAINLNWQSFWKTRGANVIKLIFSYKENEAGRIIRYV